MPTKWNLSVIQKNIFQFILKISIRFFFQMQIPFFFVADDCIWPIVNLTCLASLRGSKRGKRPKCHVTLSSKTANAVKNRENPPKTKKRPEISQKSRKIPPKTKTSLHENKYLYLTSKRAYPFHFLLVPNLWPTSKEIKSLVTPNCYLKDSIQPNWVKANGCFRLLWTMRLLRVGVGVGVGKKKNIQFCEG